MLGPTRRQQDPDQRENDVDPQVGKRLVFPVATSSASATTKTMHVRAKTAQPSFTLAPGEHPGQRALLPRPPSPRPRRLSHQASVDAIVPARQGATRFVTQVGTKSGHSPLAVGRTALVPS